MLSLGRLSLLSITGELFLPLFKSLFLSLDRPRTRPGPWATFYDGSSRALASEGIILAENPMLSFLLKDSHIDQLLKKEPV